MLAPRRLLLAVKDLTVPEAVADRMRAVSGILRVTTVDL